MLKLSRRHLLKTAATLTVLAAAPLAIARAAAEESVHSVINALIKKYSDEARAGMSNGDVSALFEKDGFRDYLDAYPVGDLAGGFVWKPGMGASFVGPYSKLQIKSPFTDYLPLTEGPVLDHSKKYRIGLVFHGFNHPWLISLADTAAWEAARHPNIELEVIDAEFDDNKMGQVIDTWIAKQYDGIVLWPNREAPMGPPVDRAIAAGIPVVSLDRRTSSEQISSEVLGNFYANGLQQGLYLKHAAPEGNIIFNRKDLGSTADSIRTGAFLEAIGNTPGYKVLANYHTNSQRTLAFKSTADAMQAFHDISVSFNTGGEEAMGALDAIREANRLNSAPGGKKIMILANDDAREVLKEIRSGNIEMVSPYTPLIGDIGIRAVVMHIGAKAGLNEAPPKLIMTPNLPMITKEKMNIEGIETLTPDEWPYAYGPEVAG
ncbi:sugar ABC transporter substrate-binding protein [Mesorhizobium sp. B2-7-2]|uniref:sugar ABC transporter substrate-binding protein n=1 Tax=Mesorhizobium sp. B2-7-2 TaxID=2589908 RepID=UPI00112AC4A7|nr:sugar ABC transporter substrate-binding protein [Mesorhizobium sp. B2-7-2]TPJ30235.1 sugar ABC transporter substrate-binding protein [Mesorhizobium sp. B2-7-2]